MCMLARCPFPVSRTCPLTRRRHCPVRSPLLQQRRRGAVAVARLVQRHLEHHADRHVAAADVGDALEARLGARLGYVALLHVGAGPGFAARQRVGADGRAAIAGVGEEARRGADDGERVVADESMVGSFCFGGTVLWASGRAVLS